MDLILESAPAPLCSETLQNLLNAEELKAHFYKKQAQIFVCTWNVASASPANAAFQECFPVEEMREQHIIAMALQECWNPEGIDWFSLETAHF